VAATPSLKVIKSSSFKGGVRLWSNRYHFNGGVPANDTQWHGFMDTVVNDEKVCYDSGTTIVECVGYDAGSDMPVSSKTYTAAGTGTFNAAGVSCPLQTAILLRWATDARSSKNHPIYLFNYFHAAYRKTGGAASDTVELVQKAAIEGYAGQWISGFSDGVHTLVRAGPNGATAGGHQVEEYLTHRDFPYTSSV